MIVIGILEDLIQVIYNSALEIVNMFHTYNNKETPLDGGILCLRKQKKGVKRYEEDRRRQSHDDL